MNIQKLIISAVLGLYVFSCVGITYSTEKINFIKDSVFSKDDPNYLPIIVSVILWSYCLPMLTLIAYEDTKHPIIYVWRHFAIVATFHLCVICVFWFYYDIFIWNIFTYCIALVI